MEFWIGLLSVVIFILSLPYIRSLIKRIIMVCRLEIVCKKQKLKLHPTHLFWMLGRCSGSSYDFYIETEHEIYSVKLFGVPRRLSVLIFMDNGKYFKRYYLAFISYTTSIVHYPIDGKKKNFQDYDFRKNFRMEWEIKTPRNILLIHPVCREIRYQPDRGGERIIGAGAFIYNCEIESLSRLISELETSHE